MPSDRPPSDPLAVSLFAEIATIDQLMRARLARALPKGMELSHFTVLNYLASSRGERSPAQLARAFHVTKAAMTNTLGKLERAGHIHVRPDWDDARRKMVVISPSGQRARDQALAAVTPVFAEAIEELGPETVRAALPTLRRLRSILTEDG